MHICLLGYFYQCLFCLLLFCFLVFFGGVFVCLFCFCFLLVCLCFLLLLLLLLKESISQLFATWGVDGKHVFFDIETLVLQL